jgi:hypothetical protein
LFGFVVLSVMLFFEDSHILPFWFLGISCLDN